MIGKELFIDSIEAIRLQMAYDVAKSEAMEEALNIDEYSIPLYDNSRLIRNIINHLRVSFPVDANGFCDIDHYCFDMNFGKIGEEEAITPEDLWRRLTNEEEDIISTHPLIDDRPTKKTKVY